MPKAKEMKPGPVAQLGERCVRNAEVESSILFGSTKKNRGMINSTVFRFLYGKRILFP